MALEDIATQDQAAPPVRRIKPDDDPALSVVDPLDVLKGQEELQAVVKDLAKYVIGLDKWVRRQEVIDVRRERFYWRNIQYIYWKSDSVGFVPASGGSSVAIGQQAVELPRYTDVYNIYTPYGESIMSTLLQNPPGVNWQPEDVSEAADITASQTAEKYQQKIESDNDRKSLQSDVARLFYTDGRTTLYTRRENDIEVITAHGVLETKAVPITCSRREDLIAYVISDELDVYRCKDLYKDYKDKIKEGSSSLGESAYERIARLGVLQGTRLLMQAGDAFSHMVTRHVVFIRPSVFEKAPDQYRQALIDSFESGLKVVFCGEAYCGSQDTSMDDEIFIGFPVPGDGMNRPGLGRGLVPLQDAFNDELNLWHEAHDYCVPTMFMYSETGDIDAIREQISEPGNIVPFTSLPPGAQSAEQAFYAAVLEAIPATLPQLVQFLQGPLAQFISGAFPALFGGDTGANDTAKGIAIQRDQAMGRMSLPWAALQSLFAGAYLQAVRSVVKNAPDDQKFTFATKDSIGNPVGQEINIQDLKNGSFKALPDTDSSFPESTNAKKQTLQTLMAAAERNPILAGIVSEPENLEFAHEVMGLPDLVVPGAESRLKQLIEIGRLLGESPVPPGMDEIQQAAVQNPQLLQAMAAWEQQAQQAQALGQPAPPMPIPPDMMKSSIPVDPVFDYHQYELQTIKNWLSGPEKRREELKGNTQGIQNIRLHGLEHEKFLALQQMQQTPTGPGAAGPQLHHAAGGQQHPPGPAGQPQPPKAQADQGRLQ